MIVKTLVIELLLDHCFDLFFVSGIKSSQELNRTFWYVVLRSAKVTVQRTTILRNQLVLILPVEVN